MFLVRVAWVFNPPCYVSPIVRPTGLFIPRETTEPTDNNNIMMFYRFPVCMCAFYAFFSFSSKSILFLGFSVVFLGFLCIACRVLLFSCGSNCASISRSS